MTTTLQDSRSRLLEAAIKVVRTKGYTAARIEDVCAEAGLTKGSFFHHFKSKDDLAEAAVAYWEEFTRGFFASAPYHAPTDPLDRLLAYVDFRKSILTGDLSEFTCFAGTIVQEAYATRPELVAACEHNIVGHARTLQADIARAMELYDAPGAWTAESLALHIQAVIQGAFILAKATGGAQAAVSSLDHLERYLGLLFSRPARRAAPLTAMGEGTTTAATQGALA
jgi:TetR/AcrR family transcriptional repressor of nem operon